MLIGLSYDISVLHIDAWIEKQLITFPSIWFYVLFSF